MKDLLLNYFFLLCNTLLSSHVTVGINATHRQISQLLDDLLSGYNRQIRPNFGEGQLIVSTNIDIRSMGPVEEEDMIFSMDCYFRQKWRDDRLTFTPISGISEIRPSIRMLHDIWKPDTYFVNGRQSYLHTITSSNRLLRIFSTGHILFSQRLTIKASCPMDLRKYPLDSQSCPLVIASYGYGNDDVIYVWDGAEPVRKSLDITMAQFTLSSISHSSANLSLHNRWGQKSVLIAEFGLQREIGYYLLQLYLPAYLTVTLSWVSFWINRETTMGRVSLGTTTLLTTCTISINGKSGIPKVSYSTALDLFFLLCFSFVFAALVEYAGVNYFTKGAQSDVIHTSDDEEGATPRSLRRESCAKRGQGQGQQSHESCGRLCLNCLRGNVQYRVVKNRTRGPSLSVSRIDSFSRIIFPVSFLALNIVYWTGCIYL